MTLLSGICGFLWTWNVLESFLLKKSSQANPPIWRSFQGLYSIFESVFTFRGKVWLQKNISFQHGTSYIWKLTNYVYLSARAHFLHAFFAKSTLQYIYNILGIIEVAYMCSSLLQLALESRDLSQAEKKNHHVDWKKL